MKYIKKDNSLTLFCFTPLVILLTFFIELLFALYVIIKYRMSLFGRLSALLLLLLAIFQLAEFGICKSTHSLLWSKIAFLSVTFLPVIGIHLVSLVTRKSMWTKIGYSLATAFSLIILFVPDIFIGTSCPGNFVVFTRMPLFNSVYVIYYFLFFLIGILILLFNKFDTRDTKNKVITWLLIAYASFIVPTSIIYIFVKVTRTAVASVLCGFAVLFAFIIIFKVLPEYKKLQNNKVKNTSENI